MQGKQAPRAEVLGTTDDPYAVNYREAVSLTRSDPALNADRLIGIVKRQCRPKEPVYATGQVDCGGLSLMNGRRRRFALLLLPVGGEFLPASLRSEHRVQIWLAVLVQSGLSAAIPTGIHMSISGASRKISLCSGNRAAGDCRRADDRKRLYLTTDAQFKWRRSDPAFDDVVRSDPLWVPAGQRLIALAVLIAL